MGHIKFLLKFGEEFHLKEFAKGSLYCSNAETFWGIEDKQKIKGQGDILEAGSRIFSQNMTMQSLDTGSITSFNMSGNILVHLEPAKHIPVFCLFTVYEDDCGIDANGQYIINLSDEKKETIKKHFPKANAVAIISEPYKFLDDVIASIGCEIKHGEVHYFHIDEGLEIEGSNQRAIDMEYMKYLMQDVPPVIKDGKTTYSFQADYVFSALFCKDVFFSDEQEYRIVLPHEKVSKGTSYPVKPHINDDGNLHGIIVIFEFARKFFFVVFGANDLLPIFRIVVAAGHNDADLLLPVRTHFHKATINFHGNRARVCHDHGFTGEQIRSAAFIVLNNVIHQRFDSGICTKNAFHLPQHLLALFDGYAIGLLLQEIISGVNELQRILIQLEVDYAALVVYGTCCAVFNGLRHIVNVNVITDSFPFGRR